jgi:hypothetical protein
MILQARENFGEPGLRVNVIELGGLDQGADRGGALVASVTRPATGWWSAKFGTSCPRAMEALVRTRSWQRREGISRSSNSSVSDPPSNGRWALRSLTAASHLSFPSAPQRAVARARTGSPWALHRNKTAAVAATSAERERSTLGRASIAAPVFGRARRVCAGRPVNSAPKAHQHSGAALGADAP